MNSGEHKSFWMEELNRHSVRKKLTTPITADICIIGAGFTGISTAIHLLEKDPSLRVTIIEKDYVGYGASGRNAGFSMRLFGVSLELTHMLHGTEKTKAADEYMIAAVQHVKKIINQYNINCDFTHDGMMTVATNERQLKQLDKEMNLAKRLDLPNLTWLDQEKTQEIVHSPTYLAARFDQHCSLIQPAKLVSELAIIAEKLGATIYEQTEVLDVDIEKGTVKTTFGNIQAEKILFATNAYSSFYKKLHRRQIPIYTYITLTDRLTTKQLERIRWNKRVGVEDTRNFLHYYRLTKDNRLLFGGSEALYHYKGPLNKDKNNGINEQLQQNLLATFPQLSGIRFTHHWGGPISASLNLIPAIGTLNDRAFFSLGCIGHGVSLTNYNGLTLAELLLGEETLRTDFFIINRRIMTIPPEPLRYAIVSGIRSFLRWEDRRGDKGK